MIQHDASSELLFSATQQPKIIYLSPYKYIVIEKKVLAETPEAFLAVKALYFFSEFIKTQSKGFGDCNDFEIYPLEGVWKLKNKEKGFVEHTNIIGNFMIKQPDFLTKELFTQHKSQLLNESKEQDFYEYLTEASYRVIDEGKNIKILHTGPYSEEQKSFDKMEEFAVSNNLKRKYEFHRESYIKDVRTVTPDQFETILKFQVADSMS